MHGTIVFALIRHGSAAYNSNGDIMKNLKTLALSLLIPLSVGVVSGFLSRDSIRAFDSAAKPPLYPAAWVFPVVWTLLYILMGLASYFALTSCANDRIVNRGLALYYIQLAFNFFWPVIFFNFSMYLFAFIWLIIMWALIIAAAVFFFRASKKAGWLMAPYIVWVTFAAYLNLGVYIVNL